MKKFAILCHMAVLYVSCMPDVRGVQLGQIYDLEVALKKTYCRSDPFELESSEFYKSETGNTQLRYNGRSSYTVLFNKNDMIDFIIKHIFLVLRNIIGIVAYPSNVNILLRFKNEQDARQMCLERYSFTNYSKNEFEIDKVLAIDNLLNEGIQVNEILNKAAIEITEMRSGPTYDRDDYYYQFTIHPTGEGPKPPVAMFVTDVLRVKLGPKSNFLVLEHEVGDGAFYFGLIFSSERNLNKFLQALTVINVKEGIGNSPVVEDITEKLFEKYLDKMDAT